jgi:hypothetical protein
LGDLSYFPNLEALMVVYAASGLFYPENKDLVFPKLTQVELHNPLFPESEIARLCLACPNLERLVLEAADIHLDSHYLGQGYLKAPQTEEESLSWALMQRAGTLRHLDIRASQYTGMWITGGDDPPAQMLKCLPHLVRLEKLVMDLASVSGNPTRFDAEHRSLFPHLPTSLREFQIVCQWPYSLRPHPASIFTHLEASEIFLGPLSTLYAEGRLPVPQNGRPFKLVFSITGPTGEPGEVADWRWWRDVVQSVAAERLGGVKLSVVQLETWLQHQPWLVVDVDAQP